MDSQANRDAQSRTGALQEAGGAGEVGTHGLAARSLALSPFTRPCISAPMPDGDSMGSQAKQDAQSRTRALEQEAVAGEVGADGIVAYSLA